MTTRRSARTGEYRAARDARRAARAAQNETTPAYCPACEKTTPWETVLVEQVAYLARGTETTPILIALNCTVCGY
jgi:hypothetical protein